MVRIASGVVSEKRFSGSDRTPNRLQSFWTTFNVTLDTNPNKPLPDLFDPPTPMGPVQDFYVYDMIKNGVPADTLAEQMGLDPSEVDKIVQRQMAVEAELNLIRDDLYQGAISQINVIV